METKNRVFWVTACCAMLMWCGVNVYADDPGSADATCGITLTVDSIIEWEGGAFAGIALETIDEHSDSPEGSDHYTLWTNCNVAISADNSNTSRLTDGTDTIRTEYKLTDDGDGSSTTGATAVEEAGCGADTWTIHSSFIPSGSDPMDITHVNTDGGVEITLYVRAVQEADEVPDSGNYTATQTLTASWVSDD